MNQVEVHCIDETEIEHVVVKIENTDEGEAIGKTDINPFEDVPENDDKDPSKAAPLASCTREEQRSVIRFLGSEGVKPFEIIKRLKAQYGKAAISKQQVYNWDKKFKSGMTEVTDAVRTGRPTIAECPDTIKSVEQIVHDNRRATLREVAAELGLSHGTAHRVLHDLLNLQKVCLRWVPRKLTIDIKERRLDICEELLSRFEYEGEIFLARIVTGDEIWVHWQEPETGPPKPKKAREATIPNKMLLTLFWDSQGPILEHYSKSRVTYYDLLVNYLKPEIQSKRPELIPGGILLLQDHPRPQMMRATAAMIDDFHFECLPHPPYSPDLAPSDFHIFGMLKDNLVGRSFDSEEEVREAIHEWLQDQPEGFYLKGMKGLVTRWHGCIDRFGEYS